MSAKFEQKSAKSEHKSAMFERKVYKVWTWIANSEHNQNFSQVFVTAV